MEQEHWRVVSMRVVPKLLQQIRCEMGLPRKPVCRGRWKAGLLGGGRALGVAAPPGA